MIIDCSEVNEDIVNVHMDQVALDSGPCYLVHVRYAGNGSVSSEELKQLAVNAVRPDHQFHSLDQLIVHVLNLVEKEQWEYPLLLMPSDYGFQAASEPTDPFSAGAAAFIRGLPFSANPFREQEEKYDLWDQGWLSEREKVAGAQGNSSIT